MDAREICKLAKSDEHFRTYFRELFEHLDRQARRGISFVEYGNYCSWSGDYFDMKPEQEGYLKSLGYKIERYLHPTKTMKKTIIKERKWWFNSRTRILVPVPMLKISACCGDES